MLTHSDDPIWLQRTFTERKRQREKHPEEPKGGFGPNVESVFARMMNAVEKDARARQDAGAGTYSDVLAEEVCELHREVPGTEQYEAEAVQIAATALRMASASRRLRMAGRE
jgi:hypothetical protein